MEARKPGPSPGRALSPATLYEIGGVYFVLYGHQSVRLQPDARKRVDQP
jgi:hypothetical protein